MEPFWFILAFILAAASLGINGLINLSFAFIAFTLGSLTIILGVCFSRSIFNQVASICEFSKQTWSWFRGPIVPKDVIRKNIHDANELRMFWESASLTGSSQIDEPLNLILSYVYRDYIYPWHFKLTHDRAFPTHLKDSINHLIYNMSSKVWADRSSNLLHIIPNSSHLFSAFLEIFSPGLYLKLCFLKLFYGHNF